MRTKYAFTANKQKKSIYIKKKQKKNKKKIKAERMYNVLSFIIYTAYSFDVLIHRYILVLQVKKKKINTHKKKTINLRINTSILINNIYIKVL